jgi:hypothetical protein
VFYNDVLEFDTASLRWARLADYVAPAPPPARRGMGFAAAGGQLYVFGGQDDAYSSRYGARGCATPSPQRPPDILSHTIIDDCLLSFPPHCLGRGDSDRTPGTLLYDDYRSLEKLPADSIDCWKTYHRNIRVGSSNERMLRRWPLRTMIWLDSEPDLFPGQTSSPTSSASIPPTWPIPGWS